MLGKEKGKVYRVGWVIIDRDVGSIGGHDTLRAPFSLRKRGHFLEMKRALLSCLKNLGGMCPQCPPVPTSIVIELHKVEDMHLQKRRNVL